MSACVEVDLDERHRYLLKATMPQGLDFAAEHWPDRLALVQTDTGDTSTWSQLRQEVSQVRSGLEAAGLKPGDKIGLLMRNQPEYPLAWLGAIEAGAIAVPVNPRYTIREVNAVLADAGASWVVITQELLASLGTPDGLGPVRADHVICLGGAPTPEALSFETIRRAPITPRTHEASVDEVVNIQFTSGTTGLPKGCLLTHRYWMQTGVYGSALFGGPQRLLGNFPYYYLVNQAHLMRAMVAGGAVYVTPGLSRSRFMQWLTDFQIDFTWVDQGMLEYPASELDTSHALEKAAMGGLPKALHATLEQRFGFRAREFYASTEVGPAFFVPFDRDDMVGSGSVGFCLPHVESKIVDSALEEVPPGTSGELCVRAVGMMLGYHNRPEVNEELFLEGGWFRTGDVATKFPDGSHVIEGRVRDMVRRSGENIASAEVEQVISALPQVEEVGVVPVPDAARGEEVKAIIVLKPGEFIEVPRVLDHCRRDLAAFKIPRYIEFRDELPHTASGKIHKVALREEHPWGKDVVDTNNLESDDSRELA